jgi:hypothetical protein
MFNRFYATKLATLTELHNGKTYIIWFELINREWYNLGFSIERLSIILKRIYNRLPKRCLQLLIKHKFEKFIMELQVIQSKIYEIRNQRVMIDFELAELYDVETRILNQAVKRNIKRFPPDFMFQLTNKEFDNLTSQNVISRWGGTRKLSYAFTEHGVTMLASILKSDRAIGINIQIVRAFIALRQFALDYAELNLKLEKFMKRLLKWQVKKHCYKNRIR